MVGLLHRGHLLNGLHFGMMAVRTVAVIHLLEFTHDLFSHLSQKETQNDDALRGGQAQFGFSVGSDENFLQFSVDVRGQLQKAHSQKHAP